MPLLLTLKISSSMYLSCVTVLAIDFGTGLISLAPESHSQLSNFPIRSNF